MKHALLKILKTKKRKFKKNINSLEKLSNSLEDSIDKLKKILQKIGEDKDELKINIQKIFTNIRNALNEREDELLNEVDNQFNNLFFNEEIIKDIEKLPKKVKISLKKGEIIKNDWNDDNKLNLLINDCLNIENDLKDIKKLNENIEKCNSKNIKIFFKPEENRENNELTNFIAAIKKFGSISNIDLAKTQKELINNINSIIVSKEEINFILNYIKENDKNFAFNSLDLLFRSSNDGDKTELLHKKCDLKNNVLIIIKSDIGKIFGGYCKIGFKSQSKPQYKIDNNCFYFQLI